jgi:hypothetical protein
MAPRKRCSCGKPMSKYLDKCGDCLRAEQAARWAEAAAIIKSGKCPKCGAGLRRNSSMTGWWQCEQYGSDGFRKDSTKPACSWQTFTEH